MSDHSNEFYDIKISRDITNEKERNIITDSLVKTEKSNSKYWYNNKCFFASALILSSTVIAIGIYLFFIFL
jgi:hypothetical protein